MRKLVERNAKIIEPKVFNDDRGFFFESFNLKNFNKKLGYQVSFVQDNHSQSSKGVLRGMHYQLPPFAQGKLVRVIAGEIFDVALDIRKSSKNFGKSICVKLSAINKKQLWIPEGFAHGFLVMSDQAEVLYKTNNYYNKDSERTILWNDLDIDINWPLNGHKPELSEKDKNGSSFSSADLFE